jgi:uncharacterized protein YaiI (UPF0178 family)
MKIWVDADACPKVIKDMLFRAAGRAKIETIFVANQWLKLPDSPFIHFIQVEQGPDIADNKIAGDCSAGDLVITADIPLAVRIVARGALGLNPRGTIYDKSNIGSISDMRDFMDTLRNDGIQTGGPKNFSPRDGEKFANELDKLIARR